MFSKSIRILHVDDSSTARMLTARALRSIGFQRLEEAVDGQVAANMIMAADQANDPYGLAIFDWKMPVMDGLQLLKFVRISSNNPDLPILLSTAEGNSESILAALKAGVDGFVLKPVQTPELEEKLKALWSRKNPSAAA